MTADVGPGENGLSQGRAMSRKTARDGIKVRAMAPAKVNAVAGRDKFATR
jgi:hypothetical protein